MILPEEEEEEEEGKKEEEEGKEEERLRKREKKAFDSGLRRKKEWKTEVGVFRMLENRYHS